MSKHVAVLKGGLSSEREVSLKSGADVSKALKELGYEVTELDVGRDIADKIKAINPDIVFNALHGTYGEDGCIPGLLEILGIPYTHSGVMASAIAMDKPMAKRLFESDGILCPPGMVMAKKEIMANKPFDSFVVKPQCDGSSVGIVMAIEDEEYSLETLDDDEEYLVEEFIDGAELSVAVNDEGALGVIEIRPKQGFYDYGNKYTKGMTEYIMPAEVSDETIEMAKHIAQKAHNLLGCRGISRADLKCSGSNLYLLEVNTHPGMTPLSLVPKMASEKGISFLDLVESLVLSARCDNR